jgi:hypothetical protein
MKTLRITLKIQKEFIDEHKLKFCMEKAVELIFKAAVEISATSNKYSLGHTKDGFKN